MEKEQTAWSEQKKLFDTLIKRQFESKEKEVSSLKNHVEVIQKELQNTRYNYHKDLGKVLNSTETQLGLLKDRELFTVSQLTELEERYNNFKQEKERLINMLKDEIED